MPINTTMTLRTSKAATKKQPFRPTDLSVRIWKKITLRRNTYPTDDEIAKSPPPTGKEWRHPLQARPSRRIAFAEKPLPSLDPANEPAHEPLPDRVLFHRVLYPVIEVGIVVDLDDDDPVAERLEVDAV